jgi:predicted RNA methylase
MTTSIIQTKGLKRNNNDKYYTNPEIVKLCIDCIRKNLIINENDLIIEPSAGNGVFINDIKLLSNNFRFYDIEPENDEIIKQNYLTLDNNNNDNDNDKIHIIGNPPFGRQSSLAIKFIKKSCEFSDSISFILPRSFKKDSLKKYFKLNFHLIFEIDLPSNSFLVNDIEYDVPCIFQIWEKRRENRIINIKLEPINFIFVKKEEEPHISFRRVGVNAGFIDTNIKDKNIQSHYFIKFINDNSIEDNLIKLSTIKFDTNNTVGPKSISKQEIISQFNLVLKD